MNNRALQQYEWLRKCQKTETTTCDSSRLDRNQGEGLVAYNLFAATNHIEAETTSKKSKKASPSDTNCDGLQATIPLVGENEKAMETDFACCDWKEHRHLSTAMQQLLLEVQEKKGCCNLLQSGMRQIKKKDNSKLSQLLTKSRFSVYLILV